MPQILKLLSSVFLFCALHLHAQQDTIINRDIEYGKAGSKQLYLDIYKLKSQKAPYLVVWVHGGAWHSGDRKNPPLNLLGYGYALASIDFRVSTEAPFPAQIHDIKAAIRFLRAHANQYGFRSDKIIIWGSSSGGHLAALTAATNNNKELGDIGDYKNTSSAVQACIDYYGPTNLVTILTQSTPHGLNVRLPALAILLGKPLEQATALAKLASPVYQVDSTTPPIFIVHGEQDAQVPINQSVELYSACKRNHVKVQIEFIPDAAHGGEAFFKAELLDKIDRFLKESGF